MKRSILLGIMLIFSMPACSPAPPNIPLTATQVAGEIFGTQTALAPSRTSTMVPPTPTITVTPSITHTPSQTITFTSTPTITDTPLPPTSTLDASGVERMMLCYKAAAIVFADMKVYLKITGLAGKSLDDMTSDTYSFEKVSARVQNFRSERGARVKSITEKVVSPTGAIKTILKVNKIQLSEPDCIDSQVQWAILSTNNALDTQRPWGLGHKDIMSGFDNSLWSAVRNLRQALETVYGVDEAKLNEISTPIFQHVFTRYGVEVTIP